MKVRIQFRRLLGTQPVLEKGSLDYSRPVALRISTAARITASASFISR